MELMVAAVITAVIVGFIVAIVSKVSGFWTRTSGKLSAGAQARHVLDQLTLDLSSAAYRDDSNVWMAVDVLNNSNGGATNLWQIASANAKPVGGVSLDLIPSRTDRPDLPVEKRGNPTKPGSIADARFGTAGVWLRFFSTKRGSNFVSSTGVTDFTTVSAPVAVGYQIIRRLSSPTAIGTGATKTAYLFHRSEARPATANGRPGVLESGYNITSGAYTTSTTTNNGATAGDPRSIQVPGSRTNFASVIADNVVDFGVRCYVRDAAAQPTGLRLVFPATNENGIASNAATAQLRAQLPPGTPATSENYNFVFPDVVDVMVRVLTDEGARLISTFEQPNSPLTLPAGTNAQTYWWQLATANSEVFTRRIVLDAKPL